MVKLIIGVVIAAVVVIGGFLVLTPIVNSSNSSTSETIDTSHAYTIEGEINKSGTYIISGSEVTMADLIEAAGGVTSNADELAYIEEAVLTVGVSYYIAPKFDYADTCHDTEISKVNINEDDAETLLTINGITSSIASGIVSYRNTNGTYNTLEDLLDVYGIGNSTYRKVRNYVTLR